MPSENQTDGTVGDNKRVFTCDPCNMNFSKKLSLEKHIKAIHINEKHVSNRTRQYHCTRCSYSTPYSQTMLNHKRIHNGEKPYQCDCGKAFAQQSTLNAHKKSHSTTTYYTCAICGKQFKLAHAFTKHLSIHETGKYNCEICHKTLKSTQTLQHHMNRHNNIKNYNCSECGDKFVTHSELLYHKQKHSNEKKLICHICEYKTNFKKCLTIHLRRHAGHKAFKCDLCNASFYTRSDEKRHQRVHTQKKCYSCPMCTQQFTRSPHVNKHMWTIHNLRFKWSELKKNSKKRPSRYLSSCSPLKKKQKTLIYFRQSLLAAIDRLIRPYYKKFSLTFNRRRDTSDDEDSDDQVFADFDDEKGVVFYPPMYAQRYAAVSDCLMDERWCGKLEKVVDLGFHDISFIKYLKEVPGVHSILGVDIDSIPLRCSFDLLGTDDYVPKRGGQLQITLFQGNAADPDYRLIGSDAVVAIEMIEHMLPHDLDRFVHTVFGFIKPWVAVFTTPNGDFNILFKSLQKNGLRRLDHFFEWTREQFHDWCSNIVVRYPQYTVTCKGIGPGPPGTRHHGSCSQLALFISKDYHKQQDLNLNSLALVANAPDPSTKLLSDIVEEFNYGDESQMLCLPNELNCSTLHVTKFSKTTQNLMARNKVDALAHTREVVDGIRHLTNQLNFNKQSLVELSGRHTWCNINWGDNAPYWNQYYAVVRQFNYPFESKSEEDRMLELLTDEINRLMDNKNNANLSMDELRLEIPMSYLMLVVGDITDDEERVKDLLLWNGYEIIDDVLVHTLVLDDSSLVSQEDETTSDVTLSALNK